MPRLFYRMADWREERAILATRQGSIGFVATMGALHQGHRALLERARAENDFVVLSIFVNPTQFDDPSDLESYPRRLPEDLLVAEGLADFVLLPSAEAIYPDDYRYRLTEYNLSTRWEGAYRHGHFEGVLTVMLKFFNLIQPHRAYFGEKDWQQLRLVTDMVRALFLPVEIVACPTIRDSDGLALSSRNSRLSVPGRFLAATFPRILREATDVASARRRLTNAGFEVDYVDDTNGMRLAAVRLEGVRLTDNFKLPALLEATESPASEGSKDIFSGGVMLH